MEMFASIGFVVAINVVINIVSSLVVYGSLGVVMPVFYRFIYKK